MGSPHDLWTVPSGKVHVVRSIDGWSEAVGADQIYIGLASSRGIQLDVPAQPSAYHWTGHQVFLAGEVVQGYSVTSPWHLIISGYELVA